MRRLLALLLFGGVLFGQNATIIMRGPEKEPESLGQLAQKLRRERKASWIVLEGTASEWVSAFRETLRTDDELAVIGLPVKSLGPKNALAAEFRNLHGWGPEARWILMGADGGELESGNRALDARRLADLLASHGILGEIRELEAFVAKHPEHIQAMESLLSLHLRLASQRTESLPGFTPPKDLEEPSQKAEPFPDLSESEDQRLWGKAAGLMERFIQSGDWRLGPLWTWAGNRYRTGRFSPLMRATSRRCLPVVEDALRQHPGHSSIWSLWSQLAENAGGRSLRPLLDSITPLPGAKDFVPEHVFVAYVRSARASGDWPGLVEVLGPRWDQKREEPVQVFAIGEEGQKADPLKASWDNVLQPLVEAHLRMGATLDADRIVREVMAWMPSKGLPTWASALAQRCGQPSLASQWAALTVPKG